MDQHNYSTRSMAQGKFRPHGHVEAIADGNLVLEHAWGPFNEELVVALSALHARLLPQMQAYARWGNLVLFHGSALAPRSTFEAFAVYTLQRTRLGQAPHVTAIAMSPDVEGGEIMSPLFIKLYRDVGLVLQIFEEMTVAERWIRAELAHDG